MSNKDLRQRMESCKCTIYVDSFCTCIRVRNSKDDSLYNSDSDLIKNSFLNSLRLITSV